MARDLTWEPAEPADPEALARDLLASVPGLADATLPRPDPTAMPDELRARLALAEPNRILELRGDGGLARITFPARTPVAEVTVHLEGDANWEVALAALRDFCTDELRDAASGRPWP